jgi:acyl-CoA thioester hydrolase
MTVFRTETRVRYVETDCAGIAHYASFFHYFEVGRMEMWRELGLPYFERLPIVETFCEYKAPARFNDLLEIHSFVAELRKKGFKIGHRVLRKDDGALLAQGYTSFVTIDADRKAVEVFPEFKEAFERHLEAPS